MSLILFILAIAGIFINLASSLRSEKENTLRRLAILGSIVAILAISFQCFKQFKEEKQSQRELQSAKNRHSQLKTQNDSLHAKIDSLSKSESALREMITPVLKIAKDRNPDSDDQRAIKELLVEISQWMYPKLLYIKEKTFTEKDEETGMLKTTYIFRSKYPVLIRDANVILTFNCRVYKANGRMPNTLPFRNNSTLNIHPDGNGVTYYARNLGEGSDMILEVFTKSQPSIQSCVLKP